MPLPWELPDVFPPRPNSSEYGYVAGGKLNACSFEELAVKCRATQVPPVTLVWTPADSRMVPPALVPGLRPDLQKNARQALRLQLFNALVFSGLMVAGLVRTPASWPFFAAMLFLVGVIPLWQTAKALRAPVEQSIDESKLAAVARFSFWVGLHPDPATTVIMVVLITVGVIEVASPGLAQAIESAGLVKPRALGSESWRLLTGPMLHANVWHLLFNLTSLATLAKMIEALAGTPRVGIVFLASAFGGSVLSALTLPAPSIGASGGVMGLLGFALVLAHRRKEDLPIPLYPSFARSAFAIALAGIIGAQVIDNAAHAGGFVVGLALGAMMIPRRGPLPVHCGRLEAIVGWAFLVVTVGAAAGAAVAMTGGPVAPLAVVLVAVAAPLYLARRRRHLTRHVFA